MTAFAIGFTSACVITAAICYCIARRKVKHLEIDDPQDMGSID